MTYLHNITPYLRLLGFTYDSECQLRTQACRAQAQVSVSYEVIYSPLAVSSLDRKWESCRTHFAGCLPKLPSPSGVAMPKQHLHQQHPAV